MKVVMWLKSYIATFLFGKRQKLPLVLRLLHFDIRRSKITKFLQQLNFPLLPKNSYICIIIQIYAIHLPSYL